jgi:hypothetical protein
MRAPRPVAVVASLLVWVAAGALGVLLLRATWPAYAAAEPGRTFTIVMMSSRVGVAVLASLSAGLVAGRLDGLRAAWIASGVLVVASTWVHVAVVWADYPAWYHAGYLLSLVPALLLAARCISPR